MIRVATSYITVATPSRDRYFDLDAVRVPAAQPEPKGDRSDRRTRVAMATDGMGDPGHHGAHPGGAPPLDWYHEVDALIDDELNRLAGKQPAHEGSPMTATFLVGDVYDRMAELPDHSFDLIITSPPFLALRSYLPADHPDKDKEIGSEATPAEYLDVLLALTAEWRRLLAPHGSLAIELGDTYAGSGGGGGDYLPGGWRDGEPGFGGSSERARGGNAAHWRQKNAWKKDSNPAAEPKCNSMCRTAAELGVMTGGIAYAHPECPLHGDPERQPPINDPGWPLDKSLTGIPDAYALSLEYGWNVLRRNAPDSPAGRWRVRNKKPWIRTNPPVGALGDKERPATSYITVACTGRDRYFDLDAVRTPYADITLKNKTRATTQGPKMEKSYGGRLSSCELTHEGAPPLDWWHQVDALIDDELNQRAGKPSRWGGTSKLRHGSGQEAANGKTERGTDGAQSVGAKGVHVRRRLEQAGYIRTLDALDISPRGYAGAHYAVWPPELVRQLVDEICPRRVCTTCGQPSRRITEASYEAHGDAAKQNAEHKAQADYVGQQRNQNAQGMIHGRATKNTTTLGWSDCGHGTWRPGRILDPFVGSGTTLAVTSGMGRDSVGIDLDARNAHLAEQRVGMFLTVDWGRHGPTDQLPPIDIIPAEDIL
jgi:hypothetical protein